MLVSDEILNRIRERVSIVELVSEQVTLKRSGRNHSGLCPFHSEKTPSFFVREEEGTFHCFGCGKKGDIFTFLMETRGFSFPESISFLANRLGIVLPQNDKTRQEDQVLKKQQQLLFQVAAVARDVFQNGLSTVGKKAQHYLSQRGINPETQKLFALGYAPGQRNWFLDQMIKSSELPEMELRATLLELGLIKQREEPHEQQREKQSEDPQGDSAPERKVSAPQLYEFFRDRLIFPITRSDGLPIAFGGRILSADVDAPKYLNSKESVIYHKRRVFYGLSQALPALRKTRQGFLVEGYMDLLSLFQRGFHTVLATCGTAVTVDHVAVLKRFLERLTILFDGDEAGRRAAASCFEVFLNSGINVEVVLLDEGEDPDSLAQKTTHDQLSRIFEHRKHALIEVYLDQLFQTLGAAETTPSAVTCGKVARKIASQLTQVLNPVEREIYLKKAVERIGVSYEALVQLLQEESKKAVNRASANNRDSANRSGTTPAPRSFGDLGRAKQGVPLHQQGTKVAASSSVIPYQKQVNTAPVLSRYLTQLLVAVLVEPRLAVTLLEMPTILEGSRVLDRLPENIKNFLVKLHQTEHPGLIGVGHRSAETPLGVDAPSADVPEEAIVLSLQALLDEFGLGNYRLLEEAKRQLRVGGSRHREIVLEAGIQSSKSLIKAEMEQLRGIEGRTDSESEKLRLAQEKLEKKRALDRLRPT